MRNRHKYGADGKKYQFKGGLVTSPEAHDRLTAEHSVSAIGAQELAVSTASCAVARAALDVRALFARWGPGDLHLRFLGPFISS